MSEIDKIEYKYKTMTTLSTHSIKKCLAEGQHTVHH